MNMHTIHEQTQCADCGTPMAISHSIVSIGELQKIGSAWRDLKGACQCYSCKRYYCYECSDLYRKCVCGACSWQQLQYISLIPDPPFYIDETGEATPNIGSNTVYLRPEMANLPAHITPNEINHYLKERERVNSPFMISRAVRRGMFKALMIAFFIGITTFTVIGNWSSIALLPAVFALIISVFSFAVVFMLVLPFLYWAKVLAIGVSKVCGRCKRPIQVTVDKPSTAWECPHCHWNHYNYWRERTPNPGKPSRSLASASASFLVVTPRPGTDDHLKNIDEGR